MRAIISKRGERDLVKIGDYMAADNKARARSFVLELREACLALSEMPDMYPLVGRYEKLGIRRRILGNYLIFYRVTRDTVFVLSILHGATDYEKALRNILPKQR